MVTVCAASSAITPPSSVQVAASFRHLSAPTMPLNQLPAFGLLTLNSRWKEATTSLPVTSWPFENCTPWRSLNTYVLPSSCTAGSASARSGTTVLLSAPATFLKVTSPSYIVAQSCQYFSS